MCCSGLGLLLSSRETLGIKGNLKTDGDSDVKRRPGRASPEKARGLRLKLATAESCTGGLVAAALTSIAGSSDVFDRGFVTYSNEAKAEMLGVNSALIEKHGAVSEAVAVAMAACALKESRAQISVAVTGIAGPGGGSAEKPVGLVHLAAAKLTRRDGDKVEFVAVHNEERLVTSAAPRCGQIRRDSLAPSARGRRP